MNAFHSSRLIIDRGFQMKLCKILLLSSGFADFSTRNDNADPAFIDAIEIGATP